MIQGTVQSTKVAPPEPPRLPAGDAPPPQLPPHQTSPWRAGFWLFAIGGLLLVLAVVGVVLLSVLRHKRDSERAGALREEIAKGPVVRAAKVTKSKGERQVVFPGDARAFLTTSLYAKTAGYLRKILVDKGDRVKEGTLLAVIESPENEQDVQAARADLMLKQQTAFRSEGLAQVGVISLQDRDTAVANLRTSEASLARWQVIRGYQELRAPFAGTVTARYVDPGALVPASLGATTGSPIVDLADTETLRVTVYLGQDIAEAVKVGDPVDLWQEEQPTKLFRAAISRLAGALDPRTRTMLAEVWLNNQKQEIYPGTYVRVRVTVKAEPLPMVPAEALIFRKGRELVAVLQGEKVKFVEVMEAENNGQQVRLSSGLQGDEQVLVNAPSDLQDGDQVQVRKPKATTDGGGEAPDGGSPSDGGAAASAGG